MNDLDEAREAMTEAERFNPDPEVVNVLTIIQQKFNCSRCGKCCHNRIGLTGAEVVQVARFFGMPGSDFKKMFCETQINRWHILRQKDNGACPFLGTGDDGLPACHIYPVRPTVCRRFPWLAPGVIMASTKVKIAVPDGMCPDMEKEFRRIKGEL